MMAYVILVVVDLVISIYTIKTELMRMTPMEKVSLYYSSKTILTYGLQKTQPRKARKKTQFKKKAYRKQNR